MIQQRLSEIGDKTARVVVAIPTRKAVTSIAQRVSVELDIPLGSKVGYSIRGQKISSPETNILFVTTGVLLKMVIKDKKNFSERFDAVILDEIHIVSGDCELLMVLLKSITKDLKLVLMSATTEVEKLDSYFGNLGYANVPGKLHHVQVRSRMHTNQVSSPSSECHIHLNINLHLDESTRKF